MSRCKIATLFLPALFFAAILKAQTLFTYGNKAVSKSEFLKAYNKNNTDEKPTEKLYRDYLDLYTRFKIKVQAALDMRLDTFANQRSELQGFRNQIVESYMNDDASVAVMIDEALERSKKDIQLAHIFIPVNKEAIEADIKKAEKTINEAYAQLQKGQSFDQVALAYSQDPAVKQNKGNVGYITVFILPYELENIIYSLQPGKFSKPIQSKAGFHILKNIGERKAAGRLKAAQILLAFPPDADAAYKENLKLKADSIVAVLKRGGDFKALAAEFSNDILTYQNGGEMMEFGIGRYDQAFETAAFSLSRDGEISKPVLTEYGYHIIKRLQLKPIPIDKNDKQVQEEIKQQVLQSDRMEVARKMLLKKVLQQTGFRKLYVDDQHLWAFTDSVLKQKPWPKPKLPGFTRETALFAFAKQTVRVKDWVNYLDAIRNVESLRTGKTNKQLFDQYVETTAFEYYRNHLEEYNADFAFQLNEFKEGNLLFEIMQRKIWDVAASDSVGLLKYYQQHKNKYWWEASADAIILTAVNDSVANLATAKLKNAFAEWRKLSEASEGMLQADSGRFELGQIPVLERTSFSPGLITAPVKNETDNSVTFAYIVKIYNNREPRNFEEARGFVINDYQTFLEEKWIESLKKKYPIKINEAVLKSLPK